MTERTGMNLPKPQNEQTNGAISLQFEQHAGHYWHSKSLTHRVLDNKDIAKKTTEPTKMRMAAYFLKLEFDPYPAKMYRADALSLVGILQKLLRSHSVKVGMGQNLHLRTPNILEI